MLQTFPSTAYTIPATDSKKDNQTGHIEITSFPEMSGCLAREVTVASQARVIMTKNVDVSDGLVNSAAGTVTGFLPTPPTDNGSKTDYKPKYILVHFDDERVGKKLRNSLKTMLPDKHSTAISVVETAVQIGKYSRVTTKRIQFPLSLAWAVTIHKEQGKTEDKLVLSCQGTFQAGQFYTAISRTRDLSGLFILGDVNANKIKVNVRSLKEIERMKKESIFMPPSLFTISCSNSHYLKVIFLNTNSLHAHLKCVQNDDIFSSSHIICFAETWFKPNNSSPEFSDCNSMRRDQSIIPSQHRHGGQIMYIHDDFHVVKEYSVTNIPIHHQVALLSPRWNPALWISVLSIYINQETTVAQTFSHLEKLLAEIPHQSVPTLILGDFNIDLLSKKPSAKHLQQLMKYHSFYQHFCKPTHRKGRLLDHIYFNRHNPGIEIGVVPVYYSDHLLLCTAIPFISLEH